MRFILTGIACCIIQSATAQLTFSHVGELLQYADRESPAARQAMLEPRIAQKDLQIQRSGIYPKVNAYATGDYYPILATQVIPAEVLGGAPGTFIKAQFGLPYVFAAGAELTMPVVNLEKWTQIRRAKLNVDQSHWNTRVALENLHLQLIQAYYQLLVTRAVAGLNQENVQTARLVLQILEQQFQQGILNPTDYNRTKNLALDVQVTAANYDRNIQQGLQSLQKLLSLPAGQALLIDDSLASFEWKPLVQPMAINVRPAYEQAMLKERNSLLALKEAKNSALPKLNLTSRYTYNMQTRWNGDGNRVEFDYANINLRLDFPLFQGNYYRAQRQKAALQVQSARYEKEQTLADLRQQQDDWLAQYQAAYLKQPNLEQQVAAARENLRIATLNVQEGLMEFDEFNNIFVEYNSARMAAIQNLADGILYYLLSTQTF